MPPQLVWFGPHTVAQAPFRQTCPAAQEVPQAPQFRALLRRSTQAPLHELKPAPQVH